MVLIVGVVKEAPVSRAVPPVAAAYHVAVPPVAVAPRVTVPTPQREAGVVAVIEGVALIVATTAVLVAAHAPLVCT